MSRLPFSIVQRASMSRVDAFDTALERAAFLASVVLLWIAGASVGYLLTIWLFS